MNALCELVAQLHEDMDAALFIVLHLSSSGIGDLLANRLQGYSTMPCRLASGETPIRKGHIYIAPPDYHLMIREGYCKTVQGPEENRWRPSIDVLFRSAAATYGDRVIGIILTGLLDDGTSGMQAIRKSGGYTLVQDPNEAEFPDMPLSVINSMVVTHSLPLSQMGFVIHELIEHATPKNAPAPPEVIAEAALSERVLTGLDDLRELADKSLYSCPDCGGGLWELEENGRRRYRCHIGHAYSEKDLMKKQGESLEATLWVALRMMEERRSLLIRIADEESRRGLSRLSKSHHERAADLKNHIDRLKDLLFRTAED
jgi:two-component system chemotaxis response regulator CheB